MTRIIAGTAANVRLQVPARGTRPTSDKVREALFSSLDAAFDFADARVLDLYAGSGALGLEAVSRGASSAVLVERAASAARLTAANADAVAARAPSARVEAVASPVRRYLEGRAETAAGEFDLVFIDPPYDLPDAEIAADLAALRPLVSPDALVVVERATRRGPLDLPAGWGLWRRREYGDTALDLLEPVDG
ncbi:MAG: 16S rRNA (guanine(966)-N(2))-methyltransferase RsmD [Microbacteriaceae bacterium]|nr:16S rRNA (guanine(966)-N(2))-methyltransferase RsmD [Microbacteriaceae bacterium]